MIRKLSAAEGALTKADKRNITKTVRYFKKVSLTLDECLDFSKKQGVSQEILDYLSEVWPLCA